MVTDRWVIFHVYVRFPEGTLQQRSLWSLARKSVGTTVTNLTWRNPKIGMPRCWSMLRKCMWMRVQALAHIHAGSRPNGQFQLLCCDLIYNRINRSKMNTRWNNDKWALNAISPVPLNTGLLIIIGIAVMGYTRWARSPRHDSVKPTRLFRMSHMVVVQATRWVPFLHIKIAAATQCSPLPNIIE